jgi:small conductance mechanosensitive channel
MFNLKAATTAEAADSIKTAGGVIKDDLAKFTPDTIGDFVDRIASGTVQLIINVAIALAVFYAGRFIIRKIHAIVAGILLRRKVEASLTTFVLSLIRIVLYFLLIVTVIGILGLETSSFIALFASAGVAIGMALSGTLQNFAGGVLILLLKPYRIGDYIEAQGYAGTVKEIQIFSTLITTADNKVIIIPNGPLSTSSINNWSRQSYRRVSWDVGISYGNNVDDARRAILAMFESDDRIVKGMIEDHGILNISKELPGVLKEKVKDHLVKTDGAPAVLVSSLGDSSVVLSVRAWTLTGNYWSVYFDYNERFYKELPTAGISFPFPQMDVHISK